MNRTDYYTIIKRKHGTKNELYVTIPLKKYEVLFHWIWIHLSPYYMYYTIYTNSCSYHRNSQRPMVEHDPICINAHSRWHGCSRNHQNDTLRTPEHMAHQVINTYPAKP